MFFHQLITKNIYKAFSLIGVGFILMALVSLLSFPITASAMSFDGTWKVSRKGVGCRPKGLIKVKIENNKFSGSYRGSSGKHIINGSVNASGSFSFQAKSPRDIVIFNGKIEDTNGLGNWHVKGRNCSGSLKIRK